MHLRSGVPRSWRELDQFGRAEGPHPPECEGPAQFFKVVLPASLPAIFTGLRLGLGFAWVVIVVGEMTGVQTGLGAIIMEARQLSRTEIVIAGMIVIGIAGFISDRIVMWLGLQQPEKPWRLFPCLPIVTSTLPSSL